ncbi:hypothetical protein LTR85_000572 [Meristemomyces frigidus]|nr:hypothetical protein LTR85_000572 [Meristemomyces frigidus]
MFAEMHTNEITPFAIGLAMFLAVLIPLAWMLAGHFESQVLPPNPFAEEHTPASTAPQADDNEAETDNSRQQQQLSLSVVTETFSIAPIDSDDLLPADTAAQAGGDEPAEGDGASAQKLTACKDAVRTLQREYDVLRVDASEARLKLAESESTVETFQNDKDDLQTALDEIGQKLTDSEAARKELEQRVPEAEARALAREKEVMDAWHEAQIENLNVPQLRKQARDARQSEKDAHARAHKAEAEADEAHQTLELGKRRMSELEEKIRTQADEIDALQRDRDNAWKRAGTLDREVKQLKRDQQLAANQHLLATQAAVQEREEARQTIEKITHKLNDTEEAHLVSPIHMRRLKQDLAAANRRIEYLEQKLSAREGSENMWEGKRLREAEYKIRIRALEREIAELKQRPNVPDIKVDGPDDGSPPDTDNRGHDDTDPKPPQSDPRAGGSPSQAPTGGNGNDTKPSTAGTGEGAGAGPAEPEVRRRSRDDMYDDLIRGSNVFVRAKKNDKPSAGRGQRPAPKSGAGRPSGPKSAVP